jgi:mono/diheme cytochrome c family protein
MNLHRLTPVEKALRRHRWIRLWIILALIAAALYYLVFVNTYVVAYEDPRQHFLHGSIGSETANGLPYWVFKALPKLYEDKLGKDAGYRKFGFLYASADADLPIGVSRRVVSGVERVWLNCAVCHVGTWRGSPDDKTNVIYGAPANNLRLYEFIQFLRGVAVDSGRFTADKLIAAIDEAGGNLGFLERLLYRYVIFKRVRDALVDINERLAFVNEQQDWGPGRVDTFNPYKALQFNFAMGKEFIDVAALNGSSDYPSIWRQRPREGMHLHWDGNNPSVQERNLSAALGAGVTPVTVDRLGIKRIEDWMWELPPPAFPRAGDVDKSRATRGRAIYAEYCAGCHGIGGADGYDYDTGRHAGLGRVVPLAAIGTDRGRWASYTPNFAAAQNLLYSGYPWRFTHFRKTNGYASHPLDGIWARSPYLHNGSVPTLADLLKPSDERPKVWCRGSDLYDFEKVGYRAEDAATCPGGAFRYDTAAPGNSNRGHEGPAYGTSLSQDEKAALVEYMKTL